MVTKRALIAEAATVDPSGGIADAVRRASMDEIRACTESSYSDGSRGDGLLHDVAVRIAMHQDVDW